jgi:hypothetical protein
MTIEWYRDLVIIILGIVAVGFCIFLAVIVFRLYHQIRPLQDAAKDTLAAAKSVVSASSDVLKPLLQLVALIQGIEKGIKVVNDILKKTRGGEHEQ